jgi:histone-lysine N-methyltransferase SETMAR
MEHVRPPSIRAVQEIRYRRYIDKEDQRFVVKYFWIKVWLPRFKNGDIECKNLPRAGRAPLTLGLQLQAFLQKSPFASPHVIAKHFLLNAHTVKEILERELGMKKLSRRWVPHSLSPAQKVAHVDTSIEMVRILQESERDDFDGVATDNESWFQYIYQSSEMFARSLADVIPRIQQAIGAKKIMMTMFFTGRRLIMLAIIPRGGQYNQLYFVDNILPDLKKGKLGFTRRMPGSTFWVHMNNSMCHNEAKIASEFVQHHLARMPHPPYSWDISPCVFWLFGLLKGILKDRKFTSSYEISAAIADVWNRLSFDDVQALFRNWMSHLAWVIENGGEYIKE